MEGHDCLWEQLKNSYGIKQIQYKSYKSKLACALIATLSNCDDEQRKKYISSFCDMYEQEMAKLERERENLAKQRRSVSFERYEMQKKIVQAQEQVQDMKNVMNQIMAPSTEEMRDRVRLAKLFKYNTNVVSSFDRTAYIKGLAMILSGQKYMDNTELDKQTRRISE